MFSPLLCPKVQGDWGSAKGTSVVVYHQSTLATTKISSFLLGLQWSVQPVVLLCSKPEAILPVPLLTSFYEICRHWESSWGSHTVLGRERLWALVSGPSCRVQHSLLLQDLPRVLPGEVAQLLGSQIVHIYVDIPSSPSFPGLVCGEEGCGLFSYRSIKSTHTLLYSLPESLSMCGGGKGRGINRGGILALCHHSLKAIVHNPHSFSSP